MGQLTIRKVCGVETRCSFPIARDWICGLYIGVVEGLAVPVYQCYPG